MKYVRTKDGKIYDSLALRVDEIVYKDEQGKWCREYRTVDPLKKALKTADTIKELIDGWVLESKAYYKSGFFVIYNTEDNKEIMENFKLLKDEKLFAFIKTDKGLIYVAKMNKKGELELL